MGGGAGALAAGLPVALALAWVHGAAGEGTARAVVASGAVLLVVLAGILVVAAARDRGWLAPGRMAALALTVAAIELTGLYFFWVSGYVRYPGDYLLWSESDFVNEILKLRLGYPLYTDQSNNESFYYTPGAPVLTYLLGSLVGLGTSVPGLRAIQVVYSALAALVAAGCVRRLLEIRGRGAGREWGALWAPFLLLAATNAQTNTFTPFLHNDALAQLVCAVAYYVLLSYEVMGDRRWVGAMAAIPVAGFLVKQSLGIWAVLYCVYLAVFRRWPMGRVAAFGAVAFGLTGGAAGVCYLLWGQPFVFWVFQAIQARTVPLRALEHVLDVWMVFAVGIGGAWVVARGPAFGRLMGPFAVWLLLLGVECYTSSAAWTLSHMGPGTLLAAVWLMAALSLHWPAADRGGAQQWFRAGARVALALLVLAGLGAIRVPLKQVTEDGRRYFEEIEAQFAGLPVDQVLLDAGTWIYLRDGVVMKDRVCSVGDRGYGGNGDFSGILARLNRKAYRRLMIRNLDAPEFWYDSHMFPKPTGIRAAILANYRETGRIRAVRAPLSERDKVHSGYLLGEISVLEPR